MRRRKASGSFFSKVMMPSTDSRNELVARALLKYFDSLTSRLLVHDELLAIGADKQRDHVCAEVTVSGKFRVVVSRPNSSAYSASKVR